MLTLVLLSGVNLTYVSSTNALFSLFTYSNEAFIHIKTEFLKLILRNKILHLYTCLYLCSKRFVSWSSTRGHVCQDRQTCQIINLTKLKLSVTIDNQTNHIRLNTNLQKFGFRDDMNCDRCNSRTTFTLFWRLMAY